MDAHTKVHTRAEWRELGFFYDRDDGAKEWVLSGSQAGLRKFAQLLRDYVTDPRKVQESEHEHYGPYMYLEVMTWPEAGIDDHSIHGPLPALGGLADIVERKLAGLKAGESAQIRQEFAESPYSLVLQVRGDDFDPASLDDNLEEDAG